MKAIVHHYNGALIRVIPGPGGDHYQADISHSYSRWRKRHKTIDRAKNWVDARMMEIERLEMPLSQTQIADYRAAAQCLPPGKSIYAVVQEWLVSHTPRAPAPLKAMVTEYLKDLTLNGRRPGTIDAARQMLARIIAHLGDVDAGSITTAHLQNALDTWGAMGVNHQISGVYASLSAAL